MNFTPTQEMIEAAETVFLAMAYEETVRPIVQAIQQKHLDEMKIQTYMEKYDWTGRDWDGKNKPITKWGDLYNAKDEDFNEIYRRCYQDYLKHWPDLKYDYCPLLMAESQRRDAQRELGRVVGPATGLDYSKIIRLEHYRKADELNLKLMAPFVDKDKTLSKVL